MKKAVIVLEVVLIALIVVASGWYHYRETKVILNAPTKEEVREIVAEEVASIPPQTSVSAIYMICDVAESSAAKVSVIIPNGSVLILDAPMDAPDYFEEVVIESTDLDDYSTYKIVGLR